MTSEHFLECVKDASHVRVDRGESDPCCCGLPMCAVEIPVRPDTEPDRRELHRRASLDLPAKDPEPVKDVWTRELFGGGAR